MLDTHPSTSNRTKEILIVSSVSLAYLLLFYLLIGFKTDQLVLVGIFNTAYYASPISRRFAIGYLVFIVYWIIFDSMKAYPNYLFNEVHIQDLYEFEKSIFGIIDNGVLLTPNEYFILHHSTFLDVATGLFYLSWIPVPMAFGLFLLYKAPKYYLQFSLTFLLVNLIGFVIYYLYPAAPPWYVQKFGFLFDMATPGNRAGLERFDAFIGVDLFQAIYSKSSNVFAAVPSLHSSYPLIVLCYGIKSKMSWKVNGFFAFVMLGIWFTAVYMTHHYIIDVLLGITCAIVGIILFNILSTKVSVFKKWLDRYEKVISPQN